MLLPVGGTDPTISRRDRSYYQSEGQILLPVGGTDPTNSRRDRSYYQSEEQILLPVRADRSYYQLEGQILLPAGGTDPTTSQSGQILLPVRGTDLTTSRRERSYYQLRLSHTVTVVEYTWYMHPATPTWLKTLHKHPESLIFKSTQGMCGRIHFEVATGVHLQWWTSHSHPSISSS